MKELSVIIVNYNVRHFLEQCLQSVTRALGNIDSEIFVVDNNSADGSCAMIKDKFPGVVLIENAENVGFSKANNQAIKKAGGRYIVLLNPDTLVEEDTFSRGIAFMDKHADAGGLSVKMIDGKGRFLPESKRSLPTPSVAFYKMFGLAKLFPRSKVFGKYHLGYLDKNQTHEIEILPGAFMMFRKEALDKTGLLDEDYFMYGEDIDISYRIIKAGYKNYYYPGTTIIHYKGESTKKGSINYVLVFYRAMAIFAKKHFGRRKARYFTFLINLSIYIRASLSIFKRFISALLIPVMDFLVAYAGYYYIEKAWAMYKFNDPGGHPDVFMHFIVPAYIVLWIIIVFLSGGYDRPFSFWRVIRGVLTGTLIILAVYALLPDNLRFSRALIMLGTLWIIASMGFLRLIYGLLKIGGYQKGFVDKKKIAIIGDLQEALKVKAMIEKARAKVEIAGVVAPSKKNDQKGYLGMMSQLEDIIKINGIDEIVFCAKKISTQEIIKNMLKLSHIDVDFKIASPGALSIVGSNSIQTPGELYVIDFNSIGKAANKRKKRMFDIGASVLLLALFPVLAFYVDRPKQFFFNIFLVLFGVYTWVGYSENTYKKKNLSMISKGILIPAEGFKKGNYSSEFAEKMDTFYAKDYKVTNDAVILYRALKKAGKKAVGKNQAHGR